MIEALQYLAMSISLLGAAGVAFPMLRLAGFCLFLAANILWMVYGIITGQPGLVYTNIGFCITSSIGLYNELRACMKKPEKEL